LTIELSIVIGERRKYVFLVIDKKANLQFESVTLSLETDSLFEPSDGTRPAQMRVQ